MFVLLGWFGTLVYLLNHGYISFVANWRRPVYYGGNLLAAIALVVSSYAAQSFQAVFINGFWALISFAILLKWPIEKVPASKRLFYLGLLSLISAFVYFGLVIGEFNITLLGWSSAFVFTFGYLLFCCNKLNQKTYLLLNVYAALVLLPQLWLDQNWPVFTLEIAWAGISLIGVLKHVNEPHLID